MDLTSISRDTSDPKKVKAYLVSIKDRKERARQIAIWVCHYGFDELVPDPIGEAPQELREYRAKKKAADEKGKRLDFDEGFWREPLIADYLEEKHLKNIKNRENFRWLIRCREALGSDYIDSFCKDKIRQRLFEFNQYFNAEKKYEPMSKDVQFNWIQESSTLIRAKDPGPKNPSV